MTPAATRTHASRIRLAVTVPGVVRGVGFRPFMERLAIRCGLGGWVRNAGGTVQIEVEGTADEVATFLKLLSEDKPQAAVVRALRTETRDALGAARFSIRESSPGDDGATATLEDLGAAPIPPDTAPCARCVEELQLDVEAPGRDERDLHDEPRADRRRAGYAFTSCTACGPRYTVALGVPYDRARTTMAGFEPCDACQAEHDDPNDHRARAQTLACPACGPRLFVCEQGGAIGAEGRHALAQAVAALRAGKILALKGVGGYQLLCDARNELATSALRNRKHREEKPFAVLFASAADLDTHCVLSGAERAEVTSPAAPIVLCATRGTSDLAPSVAKGSPLTGAMLPASPLHHLVARAFGGPLVCTSGNLSSQALCTDDDDAADRLGFVADLILAHDRPIARACDDSVVRVTAFGPMVLRRARGLAPLPVQRPRPGPAVLALGGHLKSTVAVAARSHVVVSQHIGDLDDARSVALLRATVDDLLGFLRVRPEIIACDLHPDYASTRIAEGISRAFGVPLARVQHHHAHVAAVMAERGLAGPVLGLAWDGVGDGGDGTAWGGEALLCEGAESRRLAHLRTFTLPGGDRTSREPRRSAAGVLAEIGEIDRAPDLSERERQTLMTMIERDLGAPRTSSMGRMFDAVAAIVGLRFACSYEGQAAIELEHAAAGDLLADPYPIEIVGTAAPYVVDWEPLVRAVLRDVDRRVERSEISRRFHAALAEMVAQIAERAGQGRVVLNGGCFQNARLLAAVKERLSPKGFELFTASSIPPNDGGLSLGQAHVVTERALAGMRLDHWSATATREVARGEVH